MSVTVLVRSKERPDGEFDNYIAPFERVPLQGEMLVNEGGLYRIDQVVHSPAHRDAFVQIHCVKVAEGVPGEM